MVTKETSDKPSLPRKQKFSKLISTGSRLRRKSKAALARRSPQSTLTTFEKIKLTLEFLTLIAVVAGGAWAFYQYHLSGSGNWQINISFETKVLPYRDDLRLLVIHVKSKNPRNSEITLNSNKGDSYKLRIQRIPTNAKAETVFSEDDDKSSLITTVDMLKNVGGEYEFLPTAEFDDMNSIVLPVNTTIQLTADFEKTYGSNDKNGKPDTDFISASTVVRIEP